jgi:hypothetical protein
MAETYRDAPFNKSPSSSEHLPHPGHESATDIECESVYAVFL